MEKSERLKNIIATQKNALMQLETEIDAIENSDTVQENIRLKAELEKLRVDYEKAKSNMSLLADSCQAIGHMHIVL